MGRADSPEVIEDLLSEVSAVVGPLSVVRRGGASQSEPKLQHIYDYLQQTPDELVMVADAIDAARGSWQVDRLEAQITERATELNRTHPLVDDRVLPPWYGSTPGYLRIIDWVKPVTVVQSPSANGWNDFDTHRPEVVETIIRALLTTDDIQDTLSQVLSNLQPVVLHRISGPAGPIHFITDNGNHRTHALRILDAPMIAAEVRINLLPPLLHAGGGLVPERFWQRLLDLGLVTGRTVGIEGITHLEVHDATVPWALLTPADAASISAAYERVYPDSLTACGIPAAAMTDPGAWTSWLSSS